MDLCLACSPVPIQVCILVFLSTWNLTVLVRSTCSVSFYDFIKAELKCSKLGAYKVCRLISFLLFTSLWCCLYRHIYINVNISITFRSPCAFLKSLSASFHPCLRVSFGLLSVTRWLSLHFLLFYIIEITQSVLIIVLGLVHTAP